jgi:hypothetical protein
MLKKNYNENPHFHDEELCIFSGSIFSMEYLASCGRFKALESIMKSHLVWSPALKGRCFPSQLPHPSKWLQLPPSLAFGTVGRCGDEKKAPRSSSLLPHWIECGKSGCNKEMLLRVEIHTNAEGHLNESDQSLSKQVWTNAVKASTFWQWVW